MNEPSLSLRLARKQEIAQQVFEFTLAASDGQRLGAFEAGAHITLQAPNGLWRSYSLCGSPTDTEQWRIAVKREAHGRGGSMSLIDDWAEGSELPALPVQNFFPLVKRAKSFLMVAAGIGITPIYAMVQALLAQGNAAIRLVYCSRDLASTPYAADLLALLGDRLVLHHDGGDPAKAFDFWPLFETPSNEHIYCCGPTGLMDAVRDMTGHWPSEQVHFESFTGSQVPSSQNTAFEIVLARSGQTLKVPADSSVLEVLCTHGVRVASSCESGCCGSCRVRLLAGRADHRDLVLEPAEHDSAIMVCVSRAHDEQLVLDL
jgi:phthalate 4,5-dioxygenase reductase subunit